MRKANRRATRRLSFTHNNAVVLMVFLIAVVMIFVVSNYNGPTSYGLPSGTGLAAGTEDLTIYGGDGMKLSSDEVDFTVTG